MRAVIRKSYGDPEVLELAQAPMPVAAPGRVLLRVRAFGLNRAELYMRQGAWGEVAAISGIECVGEVVTDATSKWQPGQRVMALMGGMGRSIDGSYAEYVAVPATNVIAIDSDLPWSLLATLPESYAVAWTCLMRNLALRPGHRLLVRGGSSALGLAAIDIAARLGAEVIATTRRPERVSLLLEQGARSVIIASTSLQPAVARPEVEIDAVLDLLGNASLLESLALARRGGHVCMAGFLGGLAPLIEFDPLRHMPSGVQLSFFGSFNFGSPSFPLSDIPMQQLVNGVACGDYRARPAKVFGLHELAQAHALMERDELAGKCVVEI